MYKYFTYIVWFLFVPDLVHQCYPPLFYEATWSLFYFFPSLFIILRDRFRFLHLGHVHLIDNDQLSFGNSSPSSDLLLVYCIVLCYLFCFILFLRRVRLSRYHGWTPEGCSRKGKVPSDNSWSQLWWQVTIHHIDSLVLHRSHTRINRSLNYSLNRSMKWSIKQTRVCVSFVSLRPEWCAGESRRK